MNNHKLPVTRHGLRQKQKGIATVLLVVLVGLALTATAFSITHSIRSTQEKHVAVNAVTHAQTGAWAATEAFRIYLTTLDNTTLPTLTSKSPIGIAMTAPTGTSYGAIKANITSVTDQGGGAFRVNAEIVNTHALAKSSATLGVVYEVTPAAPPLPPGAQELDMALNFYDDLDTGGSIGFVAPSSSTSVGINVDGNFSAEGVSLQNVHTLQITGTVLLGDGTTVDTIRSNEDVTIKTGANVASITTRGNVHVHAGTTIGEVYANGNVIVASSTPPGADPIMSRSNITIEAGSHGLVSAGGNVRLGQAIVNTIEAVGDVDAYTAGAISSFITSQGNLSCVNPTENIALGEVSINGTVQPGCDLTTPYLATAIEEGMTNSITVMGEIAPIVLPPFSVDVWALKQYAHYVFEYDAVKGQPKVTVKNINGIPDGEYTLGDYADNRRSYICKSINPSTGKCELPALIDAYIPMCLGSGDWTAAPCLTYDVATETWFFSESFNGNNNIPISNAAPGIMWFEGNLSVNMGYTYTSLFATGDFITRGTYLGAAVNYGDSKEICQAEGKNVYRDTSYPVYKGFYPTDMCDGAGNFTPMPAGNVAIASGGYNPADGGVYSGGKVTLANSTRVWGTVLAGTYLDTSGSVEIYGYVTAAAMSGKGTGLNNLDDSTLIDLSYITDNFNPALVPGGSPSPPTSGGGSGAPSGAAVEAKVLWSRHL